MDLEEAAYPPLIETSLVASACWAHQKQRPLILHYRVWRSVSNPVAPGAFYSQDREVGTSGKGHGSSSPKPAAEGGEGRMVPCKCPCPPTARKRSSG